MSNVNPIAAVGRTIPGANTNPAEALSKAVANTAKGVLKGHETAVGKPTAPLANQSLYANMDGKAIAMAEAVRVHGDKRIETVDKKKKNSRADGSVKLDKYMEKVERKSGARRLDKDRSGGTSSGIPRSIINGRA